MGLLRAKASSLPLEVPRPFSFPVSAEVITTLRKKRLLREATTTGEAAASLVQEQPDWLVDQAKATGARLAQRLAWRPKNEKEGIVFGITVALGWALASVEQSRGWQRPGYVDARIQTALSFAVADFPEDLKDLHPLLSFAVEAGYWVARTGENGLKELVSQPDLDELVSTDRREGL